VRDLRGDIAGDDEAVLDQHAEHVRVLVVDEELGEGCAAPDVVVADAGLREAEEDAARDVLLGRRHARVDVVGEVCDGTADAT
jgi:hypothetical protein